MARGDGASEQKSLPYRAAEGAKEIPLGSGLNPFGYDFDLESLTQADQRIDDRAILGVDLQVTDERPINFDDFDREALLVFSLLTKPDVFEEGVRRAARFVDDQ